MPDVVLPGATMTEAHPALPGAKAVPPAGISLGAYIKNPGFGKEKISADEAMDIISILSSILVADGAYRTSLGDGRVFNGQ